MKLLLRHRIFTVFTVSKYLVGGIYQRGDLKLKSFRISVEGPFKQKTTDHNKKTRLKQNTTDPSKKTLL